MSIPNYLAKIKSSGVYRYVFDKSEIPVSERNSLRLVVGYSERGPFNTPVYISDAAEFISTFGNVSRRMERKGVFFHRLAIQALEAGPILALNIKPFKNESAKMISFNASDIKCDDTMSLNLPADSIELTPYKIGADGNVQPATGMPKRFFLKPVPEYYLEVREELDTSTDDPNDKKTVYEMKFVSNDSINPSPVYIRTIEDGKEIYWTDPEIPETTTTPRVPSKLVPASGSGSEVVRAHFEYDHAYFNGEYLAVTDGEVSAPGKQMDHQKDIVDDALIALDGTNTAGERWTTIYDTNRFWKVTNNLMDITPLVAGGASKKDYMRIVQTGSKEDSVTVFMRPYVPTGYNIKISDWYAAETAEEMPSYMESLKDHYLSEFFMEIYVFRGDFRSYELFSERGTLGSYVRQIANPATSKFYPFCTVNPIDATGNEVTTTTPGSDLIAGMGKGENCVVRTNQDFLDPFGRPADALDAMADVDTSNFIGKYQGIMFPSFKDTTGTFISIDSVFNADYAAHKCLMAINEQLLDDAYEADINDNLEYDDIEVVPGEPSFNPEPKSIADLLHKLCSSVHSVSSEDGATGVKYDDYGQVQQVPVNASVVGYYLEGYNYTTILKNESGRNLVEDKIYSVFGYKGIYEALTNNVDVDYKYFIDTFQGYPGVSMKSVMTAIVKQKFNALAILNFPPMVDCAIFMGYPGLVGGFDMKEVVKRGSGITLPAEVQGASWGAYYTQLQMTDGTNKFIVPSAALVSNLFMQKWSKRQPYTIVAGPNYGRIDYPGVIGPDYNYARPDLDQLEPYGVNAIIYIPRKGVIINSNQTAKQTPVSALSKVHIRELVTYLQDTIEDMLYNYQWELNTSTLRDMVRSKADTICEVIKANGGIYAYRTRCDDRNNPPEVIDNEMVVLDIEIEPARGSGKMVQTLTLHRTGGIAANPRN